MQTCGSQAAAKVHAAPDPPLAPTVWHYPRFTVATTTCCLMYRASLAPPLGATTGVPLGGVPPTGLPHAAMLSPKAAQSMPQAAQGNSISNGNGAPQMGFRQHAMAGAGEGDSMQAAALPADMPVHSMGVCSAVAASPDAPPHHNKAAATAGVAVSSAGSNGSHSPAGRLPARDQATLLDLKHQLQASMQLDQVALS